MTNIVESIGTEDKSNNEGNITYDIMFRAVYYAARRLNSELTKIDNHTNYWEFKKVYSIWLCMGDDVPDKKAGTVSLYQMEKSDIVGIAEVPREYYDLISVIMIRLNDQMESSDGTLRMLQILCSKSAGKQQKLEELKKVRDIY